MATRWRQSRRGCGEVGKGRATNDNDDGSINKAALEGWDGWPKG